MGIDPAARSAVPSRRAESVTGTGWVVPRSVRRQVAATVMVAPEVNAGRSVTGRASVMVAVGYCVVSRLRATCGAVLPATVMLARSMRNTAWVTCPREMTMVPVTASVCR